MGCVQYNTSNKIMVCEYVGDWSKKKKHNFLAGTYVNSEKGIGCLTQAWVRKTTISNYFESFLSVRISYVIY